jgi:hypothetical protein
MIVDRNIRPYPAFHKVKQRLAFFPDPIVLIFGLSLALYTIQPWAFQIGDIPLQTVLVWFTAIWAIIFRGPLIRKHLATFSEIQWIAIGVLLIFVLTRAALDGAGYLRVWQLLTGIQIAILGGAMFRSSYGRKVAVVALVALVMASSIVALLQSRGLAVWSWSGTWYADNAGGGVPSGLETSPISFAYSMLGVATLLLAHIIFGLRNRIRLLPLSLGSAVLCLSISTAALVVSLSRSGLLGLVAAGLVLMVGAGIVRVKVVPRSFLIVLVGAAVAYVWRVKPRDTGTGFEEWRFLDNWRAFLPVIRSYPLGIPEGLENIEVLERVLLVALGTRAGALIERTGNLDPHNIFLTTAVSYGVIAAVSLTVLYQCSLRRSASPVFTPTPGQTNVGTLGAVLAGGEQRCARALLVP